MNNLISKIASSVHKQRKMSRAKSVVDAKIAGKKVVVFSKSTCPFCVRVKALLKQYNLSSDDYEVVEMDQAPHRSDMSDMQDYLLSLTGARSVSREQDAIIQFCLSFVSYTS